MAFVASLLFVVAPAASADEAKSKDCDMTYSLKGWSAVVKSAKGEGTITCKNGDTAQVEITVHGGGVTFGKTEIYNGKAEISGVHSINEIYGSYASAAAHAGVAKAGAVEVMTKGNVSIALAGSGEGVDVGIDFSKFTISKPGDAASK
jgi:hypothetical protein